MLIDTHCHLDFEIFDADRAEILSACRDLNISQIVVPSITRNAWDKTLEVCSRHAELYPAIGLHPYFLPQHREQDIEALEQYCLRRRPIAVGEIGLDFYLPKLDREHQTKLFSAQLEVAQRMQLPVIIHARKSHHQVLEILRGTIPLTGIVHAFNGSLQQANEYIKLGFKLGFGGAFTHHNAKKLRNLAQNVPLSAIVLETDAPDMRPSFAEEHHNSPINLAQILTTLSELRDENRQYLEEQIFKNSCQIFPELCK